MNSDGAYSEAFVWVWLPGAVEPVVAGKLSAEGDRLLFNYGRSYLARENAIPLYDPELPMQSGLIPLLRRSTMAIRNTSRSSHRRPISTVS